ncbi:hypothetical protein DM860_003548 [Cuscuta australis]|uniref:Uncharacterized protein n=1 Tax=Cuscuta australis TaxID=267555 RepID=A0A328DKH6_9ASTE|nr:hypothetical protein DM860_003548 [Cuscuta australis]
MVDATTRGWRDNSGIFSKQIVEERILPELNKRLGCNKNYLNYQSRLKWFKNKWNAYSELMRFSSGFGFDSTTKMFTATDEVWADYFKAHPKHSNKLRYGKFQDYEDLEIAIGNGVAVGKNSIELGSTTDARTLGTEEGRDVHIDGFDYDLENDAFISQPQSDPPFSSTSTLLSPKCHEIPMQKITQTKRNRSTYEGSGVLETLDEISTSFKRIYSLLEKREREREYTIWDAIKDTPGLDEDTQFKAIELLDNKGKKDVFLKMSPEERLKWIHHKMRG